MKNNSQWHTSEDGQAKMEVGTFVHEGKEYASGGAFISPTYAVGYPKGETLTDWIGKPIGTVHYTSSWPVRSYIGSRMHQMEATIGGVVYTGRTFGEGMLWKGKRKAKQ